MEWGSFSDDLKLRGLKGVELVVSDGLRGIMEAVTVSFIGAAWQYCHVHFMRNLMKIIPKKKWESVSLKVKGSLENESLISRSQDILMEKGFEKASEMFERWHPSLYDYLAFNKTNHGK